MSKKRKRKWIKFEKRRVRDKSRFRLILFGRPILGYNSHQLPRAKKRGDFRNIRHIHLISDKIHIPLDLKYVRYVLSDFLKRRRKRKKD